MGLCCGKCKDDEDSPRDPPRIVRVSEQSRSNSGFLRSNNDPPCINRNGRIQTISENYSLGNSRIFCDVSSNQRLRQERDRTPRSALVQPILKPILVTATSRRAGQTENVRNQTYVTPNIQHCNHLRFNTTLSSKKVVTHPHSTDFQKKLEFKDPVVLRRHTVVRNVSLIKEILKSIQNPKLYVPPKRNYIEKILDKESKSYKFVMSKFGNKKFNTVYEIKKISHIWNPYLFLQYSLNKEKCKSFIETRIMYHGTQIKHLDGILTDNFNWRKVKSAWYGYGVYFANNPWYASHYSKNEDGNNGYNAMILARVLVGETCYGNRRMIVPTHADSARNPNGQALVKFDDGYFYPEFVIYFEKIDHQSNRFIDPEDEWMLE